MKKLFTLYVDIKNTLEVKGQNKTVRMLAFSGRAEGDSFNGEILPCAMDMQTLLKDGNGSLSARYAIKGTDSDGKECLMFIENNARLGSDITRPCITTDSKALSYLENSKMIGRMETKDGQFMIHIFDEGGFNAVPDSYFSKIKESGSIECLDYESEDYIKGNGSITKRALVYIPYGYDESKKYNVMYIMHGGSDSEIWYFTNAGKIADFKDVDFNKYDFGNSDLKNLLDNMIKNKELEPCIVCTPTYQSVYDTTELISTQVFYKELLNDLIPALENKYSTYYNGNSEKSRMHRAFGGFSMGSACTWSVFENAICDVGYFMPMSGDCWHFGTRSGKINTVKTVDFLENVVRKSGLTNEDFYIYAGCGDTVDIAYENMTPQIEEMKKRDEIFKYSDNCFDGNLYYCVDPDGNHTIQTAYTVIYNGLSKFFRK